LADPTAADVCAAFRSLKDKTIETQEAQKTNSFKLILASIKDSKSQSISDLASQCTKNFEGQLGLKGGDLDKIAKAIQDDTWSFELFTLVKTAQNAKSADFEALVGAVNVTDEVAKKVANCDFDLFKDIAAIADEKVWNKTQKSQMLTDCLTKLQANGVADGIVAIVADQKKKDDQIKQLQDEAKNIKDQVAAAINDAGIAAAVAKALKPTTMEKATNFGLNTFASTLGSIGGAVLAQHIMPKSDDDESEEASGSDDE